MIVELAGPDGEFVLPEPPPPRLLFLTAGSGAAESGVADVVLLHSAPTPKDVIFGAELRALAARSPNLRLYERHTRIGGRLRPADLPDLCPDWAPRTAWVCGPAGMLEEAEEHWAGSADRLHIERFRPAAPTAGGEGGRIRFTKSGRQTDADGGTPLLIAGEEAGVLMPSGCRMGICHSCVGRLASGGYVTCVPVRSTAKRETLSRPVRRPPPARSR
jgi:ferredoxin-NADP reductase